MGNSTMAFLDTTGAGNVAVITGPTIVGSTLNWYLHGVLTVQYLLYIIYSPSDPMAIKVIVHLIYALDTIQSILTMDDIFFWFVHNFGDANKLFEFRWAFDIPTLDAIIGFLVQAVYCWRIWKLSNWRILPLVTITVALAAGAAGFACGIRFQVTGSPSLANGLNVAMMLWLFGNTATDVVIAFSMTYILLRAGKASARTRSTTGARILRLLTLTLETNAITAAAAIVTVILFLVKPVAPPRTNFYQLGGYLLGKLYSNCFMILLNQRHARNADTKSGPNIEPQHFSRSRSGGDMELGSRPAPVTRAVVTTITVDDRGHYLPTKARNLSLTDDQTFKSKVSFGV